MATKPLKKCRKGELRSLRTKKYGKTWYKCTTSGGFGIFAVGFEYDLPKKGKPGKWHVHTKALKHCQSGFHVTQQPYAWTRMASRVFEVEATGFKKTNDTDWNKAHKSLCRAIRLVREINYGSRKWDSLMRRSH